MQKNNKLSAREVAAIRAAAGETSLEDLMWWGFKLGAELMEDEETPPGIQIFATEASAKTFKKKTGKKWNDGFENLKMCIIMARMFQSLPGWEEMAPAKTIRTTVAAMEGMADFEDDQPFYAMRVHRWLWWYLVESMPTELGKQRGAALLLWYCIHTNFPVEVETVVDNVHVTRVGDVSFIVRYKGLAPATMFLEKEGDYYQGDMDTYSDSNLLEALESAYVHRIEHDNSPKYLAEVAQALELMKSDERLANRLA